MPKINPQIEESWKNVLRDEFDKGYFSQIKNFLVSERKQFRVFPPGALIFNAFDSTPFDKVKVVLLGQDPYHGEGQAHGLCFSVPKGVKPPPSLINIFKEIQTDVGGVVSNHGDLSHWADQGVLLLNATLTVRSGQAGSHQGKGWEEFTNAAIAKISALKSHVVFLLWGRYAQQKANLIDSSKHLILEAAHPSPFSADNGFFGCGHFSKANQYLKEHGIQEIKW